MVLAIACRASEDERFKLFEVHEMNETDNIDDYMGQDNTDHLFTVSLEPGHRAITLQETFNMKPPGVPADNPVATSYVTIFCFDPDGDACEVELDITDSLYWEGVLYRHSRSSFYLKVNYFEYYKFYFTLVNNSRKPLLITMSHYCEKCGKPAFAPNSFVTSLNFKQKMANLQKIMIDLNQMALLTTRTKAIVLSYTKNILNAENKLHSFAVVEVAVLILIAVWQVFHLKKVFMRQVFL